MKTDDLGKHGLFVCMSMPVHPRVSPTHPQGGTRHVAAAQNLQQKSQTTSEIIYKWINSGFPYLGKTWWIKGGLTIYPFINGG